MKSEGQKKRRRETLEDASGDCSEFIKCRAIYLLVLVLMVNIKRRGNKKQKNISTEFIVEKVRLAFKAREVALKILRTLIQPYIIDNTENH